MSEMAELPSVDVYFSFRSPYSFLASADIVKLSEDYQLDVNLRPVLPLAVRQPDFFSPENMKRARYIVLDWPRRAEYLGIQHAWPDPDPIVQDMATLTIAEEQPYIYRLTMLGVEAARRGAGCEFANHVSNLIFGGTRGWDQGDHLAQAVKRAGLDLRELEASIADGDHMDEVERNQQALKKAGHWGAPTFVFEDEPFFGQDRVDLLRWRLDQAGVARR
jgi:2-hydroxychromene-2-carboxylate isomerase